MEAVGSAATDFVPTTPDPEALEGGNVPDRTVAEQPHSSDTIEPYSNGPYQYPLLADAGNENASPGNAAAQHLQGSAAANSQAAPQYQKNGVTYEQTDGVPQYKQADPQWSSSHLGTGGSSTLQKEGCAVTATSMLLSKVKGTTITPSDLNDYLKNNPNGFGGADHNRISWGAAAGAGGGVDASLSRQDGVTDAALDNAIRQGGGVVLGVSHAGSNATQHWIAVTGRNPDGGYNANDPASGKPITLDVQRDGSLKEHWTGPPTNQHPYSSTGPYVSVTR